jgi:hypothetical protein
MFDPRMRSTYALLAIVLALAACSASSYDTMSSDRVADGGAEARHDGHPGSIDASVPPPHDASHGRDAMPAPGDAPRPDAGGSTGADAGGADASGDAGQVASPGIVSCYAASDPEATCTLPTHCCFTNYGVQRNGECMTSACTWGTIECDGPEDCATGQRCCAHAIVDPENGTVGYALACQSSVCGAAPANQELCHPTSGAAGTCSSGGACVSARDFDYDLPATLNICR